MAKGSRISMIYQDAEVFAVVDETDALWKSRYEFERTDSPDGRQAGYRIGAEDTTDVVTSIDLTEGEYLLMIEALIKLIPEARRKVFVRRLALEVASNEDPQ